MIPALQPCPQTQFYCLGCSSVVSTSERCPKCGSIKICSLEKWFDRVSDLRAAVPERKEP